jgi:hypothetical protein
VADTSPSRGWSVIELVAELALYLMLQRNSQRDCKFERDGWALAGGAVC